MTRRMGEAGLWSLLHTAELAALQMAALPGLDDDLSFTEAAFDTPLRRPWGSCRKSAARKCSNPRSRSTTTVLNVALLAIAALLLHRFCAPVAGK